MVAWWFRIPFWQRVAAGFVLGALAGWLMGPAAGTWLQPLGTLYINRTQFGRILSEGGYDAKAFLSWAVRQGIVKGTVKPGTDKIIPTKTIKRGGVAARYVEIAMQNGFQGPDEAENSEEFV